MNFKSDPLERILCSALCRRLAPLFDKSSRSECPYQADAEKWDALH